MFGLHENRELCRYSSIKNVDMSKSEIKIRKERGRGGGGQLEFKGPEARRKGCWEWKRGLLLVERRKSAVMEKKKQGNTLFVSSLSLWHFPGRGGGGGACSAASQSAQFVTLIRSLTVCERKPKKGQLLFRTIKVEGCCV